MWKVPSEELSLPLGFVLPKAQQNLCAAVWWQLQTELSFSSCDETRVYFETTKKAEGGIWRGGKTWNNYKGQEGVQWLIGWGGRNSSDEATLVKCRAENAGLWVIKSSQSPWGGDQSP